jgi:hypothetical protein
MTCRTAVAVVLKLMFVVLIVAVVGGVAAAQSVSPSEVEVRLVQTPHGGCFGPCVKYEITVRGDGSVEYNGVGRVEGTRTRKVSADEGRISEGFCAQRDGSVRPASVVGRPGISAAENHNGLIDAAAVPY